MMLAEERRRKRSQDPLVALHYQLVHAREEGRFEAIVVADDAGVVVAGAGAWAACEELAAYAPLLVQQDWKGASSRDGRDESRMVAMSAEVNVQTVAFGGQTVLLCARGGAAASASMDRTALGVARILSQAA